jgi:hypothetical protein
MNAFPFDSEKDFESFFMEDNYQLPPLLQNNSVKKQSYFDVSFPFGRSCIKAISIEGDFSAIFN